MGTARSTTIASILAVLVASGVGPLGAAAPARGVAPVADPVPGRYIVTLGPAIGAGEVAEAARALARAHGGTVGFVYRSALRGFSLAASERAATALSSDPRVALVEEDGVARAGTVQSGATWGIDRVDQRDLPLDAAYGYEGNGAGVHVYVIDTGIRTSHVEFAARIGNGYSAIDDGRGTTDCHGHGTHVAGTVGGTTYGVAKGSTLHPVRVLNCSGSGYWSQVIAGVDWVTRNAVRPAVANMSLGGGATSSVDTAVANSIASGVTYSIAAGNANGDACTTTPARVGTALTVGATASSDARASFSNWGTCLDLFAPGSSITSAYYSSDTATATMSGTSMAAPHVAGVAARYLETDPAASPATVGDAIRSNATAGHVSGPGTGSPNLLLYSSFLGTPPVAPPPPPPPPPSPIALVASGYRVRSIPHVDLSWTGGSGTTVDVWRNGAVLAAGIPNDGAFTDVLAKRSKGDFTYRVCEAGSTTACSNDASVAF